MPKRIIRHAGLKKHLPEDSCIVIWQNLKSSFGAEDFEVMVIFLGVEQNVRRIVYKRRRSSFGK
jgi:hypothetical protein